MKDYFVDLDRAEDRAESDYDELRQRATDFRAVVEVVSNWQRNLTTLSLFDDQAKGDLDKVNDQMQAMAELTDDVFDRLNTMVNDARQRWLDAQDEAGIPDDTFDALAEVDEETGLPVGEVPW